jgi:serine/threonine-protein kinase
MASVWVARQRGKYGFEKLVAIKTILPKFAADIRFQEMFLDEARIASRIEHVNVAHILDLGEEHEILYLVMEYVDGDALSKLYRACQRKGVRTSTGVVLRVLADACAGLHEAHELTDTDGRPLDIVHRDISPHNILVSTRGNAKLIDFGIAKARSRVGTDTGSGMLKGKIQYMAPEQALGHHVDRRADVWAVGAILYHMLAGRPPYEGDNQLATLHLLGSGRPPVPLGLEIHPAIAALVMRALSHKPENRFATAAELRAALENAMAEAMVPTTPADVAAFAAEHLRERADRRRHAIDSALVAAAERRRVEDLLRPAGERTSMTNIAPQSAARLIAPAPLDSIPPLERMTMPEVPAAKTSGDAAARLTARLPDPPPHSPSYAAPLEWAGNLPQPRSRKSLVVAGAVFAAATLATASVAIVRSSSTVPLRATAVQTIAADPPAPSAPFPPSAATQSTTAVAAPTPVAGPPADDSPAIPAVAATTLPKVWSKSATPPARSNALQRGASGSRTVEESGPERERRSPAASHATPASPVPPPAVSVKTKPPVVDDGF